MGFLKSFFSKKDFLKMLIIHFANKDLAPDQFLHGVKLT